MNPIILLIITGSHHKVQPVGSLGCSDISFGLCEYLLSPVLTSPYPLWEISASVVEGISVTYGRHPYRPFPLPSTKIRHRTTRYVAKSGRK